jgi:lipoprotein-anchoring transpeptidase ErfK/SrfK
LRVPFHFRGERKEKAMRRRLQANTRNRNHLTSLAALILLTAAEALGQDDRANTAKRATSGEQPATAARRIVVSIPDRKLALIEDGRVVKVYRVAVGAEVSPSPTGALTIVHRVSQPTYYRPGIVIPPGKSNPLGTRWIGLSTPGYGIHGTNQPESVGRNASHGCIRMRNRDVEDLFERVRAGDAVEMYAERTDELAEIFGAPADATKVVAAAAAATPAAGTGNQQ